MKKAFLVTFCPTTRVVVDIEEDQFDASLIDSVSIEDDFKYSEIVRMARQQIIWNGIDEYLNGENICSIQLDEEFPYDPDLDIDL